MAKSGSRSSCVAVCPSQSAAACVSKGRKDRGMQVSWIRIGICLFPEAGEEGDGVAPEMRGGGYKGGGADLGASD